jgi:hypothetical protein
MRCRAVRINWVPLSSWARASTSLGIVLAALALSAGPAGASATVLTYLKEATLSRAVIAGQPDSLGISVAVDAAGTEAIVGADGYGTASGFGAAYVYSNPYGINWTSTGPVKLSLDPSQAKPQFGISVALSADGTVALVGSNGAAFVYTYSSGAWQGPVELQEHLGASSGFGTAVALSGDGKTALIGDFQNPDPVAYYNDGSGWKPYTYIDLGSGVKEAGAVALNYDGSLALVGSPFTTPSGQPGDGGQVEVIELSGGIAHTLTPISPANENQGENFGWSVQLATAPGGPGAGDTAIIGAFGAAYEVGLASTVHSFLRSINLNGYYAEGMVALSGDDRHVLVLTRKNKHTYVLPLGGPLLQDLSSPIPFDRGVSLALDNDGATAILGNPTLAVDNKPGIGEAFAYRGVPSWWLATSISTVQCNSCTKIKWRAPKPILSFLAGYDVYRGKRLLSKTLVASETRSFSFKIRGKFKHLRAAPVLGIPPACITGGPYSDTFDRRLGDGWTSYVPQGGPSFSLKASRGCERLTVPDTNVYDSWSNADNAPELLRTASAAHAWTATTRLTLSNVGAGSGPSSAPPGFHTGMVLRLPTIPGTAYPTQLYWGLYRASPDNQISLRLEQTGTQNLVDVPGVPTTMDLRVTFAPASCTYRFWYAYPGQTAFTDSGYSYNSCVQNPQVGLITKTFGSPVAVTTLFDWFDVKTR